MFNRKNFEVGFILTSYTALYGFVLYELLAVLFRYSKISGIIIVSIAVATVLIFIIGHVYRFYTDETYKKEVIEKNDY
jgi:uncharacterized membrane protein